MHISNQLLAIAVILLSLATIVGWITRKLRLPYTVGLVLLGLGLGLLNSLSIDLLPEPLLELVEFTRQSITPDFILGLLVTPLIFEAAFHLNWDDLRRDIVLILALAVPGVLATTILIGSLIYLGTDFQFSVALLFGAMMAATDPVSVIALFRYLGVPTRLQVLVEGESLFNDGTAIVIFALVFNMVKAANVITPALDTKLVLQFLADFIRVAGGGLITGLFTGWIVSLLISRIDDYLLETTLTTVLAFGTYLVAEQLEVSGVLAVVAAGLVNGNIGPKGMSPTTHIQVTNFWEYASFLSNSVIFLLIGLEIDLPSLLARFRPTLLAILVVLLVRAIVIYSFSWFNREVPWRWRHIIFWGGLRGAVSLALALNLPASLEWSTDLRNMTFGVVLFTILVQGFSTQPLVKHLHLVERNEMQEEYERRHARAVAASAAYDHLKQMYRGGLFSQHTWQLLAPILKEHAESLAEAVKEVIEIDPSVEAEELDTARREALRAQRSALIGLLQDGVISEDVYSQLSRSIDIQLSKSQSHWIHMIKEKLLAPHINRLMTAVVQVQDVENAINGLNEASLPVTRLPSTGGFLGRRNVTLLIGLAEGQEELVHDTLRRNCRRRIEYIATPLEGSPFHLPLTTPVTVGGATIFTFKVEHYEEI
ncbi:MAG: cyclic-di-AMP receptor [Chloroflexota bacterium]